MNASRTDRRAGFTLLEMAISLVVMGILFATVFSITLETYAFIGDTDLDQAVQTEANQAFDRMTEILRKCGWNTAAGVSYPRVVSGGSELEFQVLRDLDGNGYPFSAATGELEFGPTVYRIRRDGAGNLRIYSGPNAVWHLCRSVQNVQFETYRENNALQMKEIRVSLQTRKLNKRGEALDFSLVGSIDMRN